MMLLLLLLLLPFFNVSGISRHVTAQPIHMS